MSSPRRRRPIGVASRRWSLLFQTIHPLNAQHSALLKDLPTHMCFADGEQVTLVIDATVLDWL